MSVYRKRAWPWLWYLLVPVMLISSSLHAGTAAELATRIFAELDTFQALFEQQVIDAGGRVIQQSSGRVAIKRPGRFRWDYHSPYRQLIVADGIQMWIYDEDLEQVTISQLDSSLEQTPALLLSKQVNLDDNFLLQDLPDGQGLQWLSMTPKDVSATYNEIRLGMAQDGLRAMELIDGFGQLTRLRFNDVHINEAVPASWFSFEPPAHADIIYGHDMPSTAQ